MLLMNAKHGVGCSVQFGAPGGHGGSGPPAPGGCGLSGWGAGVPGGHGGGGGFPGGHGGGL